MDVEGRVPKAQPYFKRDSIKNIAGETILFCRSPLVHASQWGLFKTMFLLGLISVVSIVSV